jgi:leader peptidase (prepilin peptidase)/N-methyltransferase
MAANVPLLLQAVGFTVLLAAAAVCDIRKRIIPDLLCAGIALTSLLAFEPENLAGALIAVIPLVIARLFGGIEGGDIKLMAASGLVLGFRQSLAAAILGFTAFAVFSGIYILIRKARGGDTERKPYPLAPFLSLGCLAAYFLF